MTRSSSSSIRLKPDNKRRRCRAKTEQESEIRRGEAPLRQYCQGTGRVTKMEDGIIVGGRAGPGQKGGSLVSLARFKDFELEVDFMLAGQPAAPDGSCTTCTYNSGVYLRTGYQVN